MAGSTWIWNGGSAAGSSTNWTLISGPGNSNHHPQGGDTGIVPDGTVAIGSDPNFQGNTIEIGGTAGTAAALTVAGDSSNDFSVPSANGTTLITSAVPGHTTPEVSVLDAGGTFINEGTILADGPAGSVFTINVAQTTAGTVTLPGYFFNAGTIEADAGNTLIVNIGPGSALLNSGSIVADGGTVVVNVAPGAIADGDAPVRGFEVIEGGGTLITAASYPAGNGNNGTHGEYEFGDSSSGNTLKIENVGNFGGVIIGFSAGDTIDLGTALTVGTLAYSTATNLLSLEAANGTTLASLILGNFGTGLATGSFPVVDGIANSLTLGVGTDGDTVLTTSGTLVRASGISGAWQSAGSWLNGVVPGTKASVTIGLGASAPFTLTTGGTPVSVGGFGIDNALATVEITSDTTLTTGQASDYAGTLDIAAGTTLTAAAIQLYEPSTSLTIAAGATAELAGRIDLNLAPSGGIWAVQPGGNPYALLVSAGTAVIDGALLAGPSQTTRGGSTAIGYDSAGQPATVIVNAGGTVTDTHATLGSDLTSSGTLILDGPGANWTDKIDAADTSNSRGYITVGYDDLVSDIPAGLTDPGYAAPAQLLVENGATLSDQEAGYIGDSPDSAGNVTVENGGLWDLSSSASNGAGFLDVGQSGSGTLSVLAGGSVELGSLGTFLSNGTDFTGGGMGIGQHAGSNGTVIVDGAGARISSLYAIAVGKAGQGLLEILNGGTVSLASSVTSGDAVTAGVTTGSSGTVIVSGSGALLTLGVAGGALHAGDAGQGVIEVESGGSIYIADDNLDLGGSGNNTGTITPGGGHGTVDVSSGGRIEVGVNINMFAGSTLSVDSTSAIDVGTGGSFATGAVLVENGHDLLGDGLVNAPVVNNGELFAANTSNVSASTGGGTLEISGSISGAGLIDLGPNMTLRLDTSIAASQAVYFATNGAGALILNTPGTGFNTAIHGLAVGDRIEFGGGMTITSASVVNADTIAVDFHGSGGQPGIYDLTDVSFASISDEGFSVGTDATTGDSYVQVGAAAPSPRTLIWTGASNTNFANAANWDDTTNNLDPATSAPGAIDTAEFIGGSTAITGTGTAATLSFGGGSAWNLAAGGSLTAIGSVTDGTNQNAVLLIDDGANLTAGGNATIAATAGASGSSANVTGSGSTWQVGGSLTVGGGGAGVLDITNGATVTAATLDAGAAAGSAGIVTVTGANADLVTTGSLSVGDAGSGELSILNGANVFIGGDFDIGHTAGGSGNVDIEDATGTVYVGGDLDIGLNGDPAVLTVGPTSTLEVDNGFINGGPGGVLNLYTTIDPPAFVNLTINIETTPAQPQVLADYAENDTFSITQGVTYILNTPTIFGTTSFTLGTAADTQGATLILNADTVSAPTSIDFTNALGTLVIGVDQLATQDNPITRASEPDPNDGDPSIGGFHGTIRNFTAGDMIEVNTAGPATFSQSGAVVSVIENGTTVGVLTFDNAANAQAAVSADALVDNVLCFLAGTLIGTPDGQVAVERLAAGDRVRTASGAVRPVVWVGHGRVLATRGRRGPATPVIVRKGALGPNVPHTDLFVTKGHSFYVDGVLIPVEFLVNHRSILWDDRAQEVSVYHVELETHDVLVANGAAAESYRDDGNRWLFGNANSGWGQAPKPPCAPVLTGGPVVDAAWRRLLDACGPRPSVPLTEDPDLHLLVDGVRVDGVRAGDVLVFAVPPAIGSVRLMSRAAVPQELGVTRDPRLLGVAVRRVVVRQGTRFRVIRGDDPLLADGFHALEPGTGVRWTDGDATLPGALFEGFAGPREVVVHLGGTATYVDDGVAVAVA